jgi:hypothetical protein
MISRKHSLTAKTPFFQTLNSLQTSKLQLVIDEYRKRYFFSHRRHSDSLKTQNESADKLESFKSPKRVIIRNNLNLRTYFK